MYTKTLVDGTVYEYSDENWNDHDYGRLVREIATDGTYKLFEEYYAGTDQARYIESYDSGDVLFETAEYDVDGNLVEWTDHVDGEIYTYYIPSGRMYTKTLQDGTVYEYSDEDWNGHDYGRLIKEIAPDGIYWTFEDHYPDSDQARFITEYALDGSYIVCEKDVSGSDAETTSYDAEDHILTKIDHINSIDYTYYVPSGNIKTETLPDWTLNEYYDEDLNRLWRETFPDGITLEYLDYYGTSNQARYIKTYDGVVLLETAEYDEDGNLLNTTYHT